MNEQEPSQFLREQMQRETDEAVRKAKFPEPPPATSEDEDGLFEEAMKRFPKQAA